MTCAAIWVREVCQLFAEFGHTSGWTLCLSCGIRIHAGFFNISISVSFLRDILTCLGAILMWNNYCYLWTTDLRSLDRLSHWPDVRSAWWGITNKTTNEHYDTISNNGGKEKTCHPLQSRAQVFSRTTGTTGVLHPNYTYFGLFYPSIGKGAGFISAAPNFQTCHLVSTNQLLMTMCKQLVGPAAGVTRSLSRKTDL